MKTIITTILIAIAITGINTAEANKNDIDKDKILEIVRDIEEYQDKLEEEIEELKASLGMTPGIDGAMPVEAHKTASPRIKLRTEDGIKSFLKNDYEQAKEEFQGAWEEKPNNAEANYNLGLVYYKTGNTALAKKMLKTAIEIDPQIKNAAEIEEFIHGKKNTANQNDEEDVTPEERAVRTEMVNLRRETESYIRTKNMEL